MRFFKSNPQVYAQIQPAVDDAFRAEYIDSGRCDHILPVTLPTQSDGNVYVAVPGWFFDVPQAASFAQTPGVIEVTEAEYQSATQPQEGPQP